MRSGLDSLEQLEIHMMRQDLFLGSLSPFEPFGQLILILRFFDFFTVLLLAFWTARTASSKTWFNPDPVKADVSMYLYALILLANLRADSRLTGLCPAAAKAKMVSLSSLRSLLVPTRMIGVFGQWYLSSGIHLQRMLSKEGGETTEKQRRKTSVCGYESGLNRS